MVVRTDAASSSNEPQRPKGPTASALRKALSQGIETATKALLTKYLGEGPAEGVSTVAAQLIDKAIDGFAAPEGVQSGAKLKTAANDFATDYLDRLLKGLAGDPPTSGDPKTEKNLRYLNPRTQYTTKVADGYKLRLTNHFLAAALKALGIPEVFGEGVNQAITQAKNDREAHDLGEKPTDEKQGGWLKTIQYLFAGILRDNNQVALAKILEAVPVEAITGAKTQQKPVDSIDNTPKAPNTDNGSASSAAPRASNFASFYIAERAYGTKAGKKETPQISSNEELIKHVVSDVLKPSTPIADDQVAALAKDLQKAFAPLERASRVDQLGVIQELLKLLMADSLAQERSVKPLRSSVKELEGKKSKLEAQIADPKGADVAELNKQLDALKADLKQAQAKLKGAESAAGRQASWNNLATYFGIFARDHGGADLTQAGGIDKALNQGIAFALEKLVAQRLGVEIPGDSLTGALKKYSAILQNIRENGALSARARQKFETSNPEQVYAPLISQIDKSDIPGSAKKLAEALMERAPDKTRLPEITQIVEGIIGKATTNLDLVGLCVDEIKKQTGLSEKDLGLDQFLEGLTGMQHAGNDVLTCKKEIENLDKGIRNLTEQINAIDPQGVTSKADGLAARKQRLTERGEGIDRKLAEVGEQIGKLETRLNSPRLKNKQPLETQIAGLKKRQHGLEAQKAELTKSLEQIDKDAAGLEKTVAGHKDPDARAYFEGSYQLKGLNAELEKLKKAEKPDTAKIDALTKKIAELQPKVDALKTPEREEYAELRTRVRGLVKEREALGKQRDQVRGSLDDLEYRQQQMSGKTDEVALQMLQMMTGAVLNGAEIKKQFEADKADREKAGKDGDKTKGPGGNDPPGGGNGGADRAGGTGGPSSSPAARKANAMVQERIRMCDLILSDPSLSTQDKILLFILTYAEYKKREQEDHLREMNKSEEKRNTWSSDREEIERELKAQEAAVAEIEPRLRAAEADFAKAAKGTPDYAAKSEELQAAKNAMENAQREFAARTAKLQSHDSKPEAAQDKQMQMMMIERSMQEYDHLLRMADSLLQRYDRLVDQILRSMGQ